MQPEAPGPPLHPSAEVLEGLGYSTDGSGTADGRPGKRLPASAPQRGQNGSSADLKKSRKRPFVKYMSVKDIYTEDQTKILGAGGTARSKGYDEEGAAAAWHFDPTVSLSADELRAKYRNVDAREDEWHRVQRAKRAAKDLERDEKVRSVSPAWFH